MVENSTPKVRFFLSNFWGAVQFSQSVTPLILSLILLLGHNEYPHRYGGQFMN